MSFEINTEIEKSGPGMGWRDELVLTPAHFYSLADGASLTTATTGIGRARDNSVYVTLHAGGSVDQTGGFETSFPVPGWLYTGGDLNRRPQFAVEVAARKVDLTGSATENADLSFTATLLVKGLADDTLTSLGSFTQVLPAKVAANAPGTMLRYSGELLSATTAANLARLVPGAIFVLRLTFNEAIGTNLAVRFQHVRVQVRRDIKVKDAQVI